MIVAASAPTATAVCATIAMAAPPALAAGMPTIFTLADGPQLSTISESSVQAGPAFSDAGYVVLAAAALAFGARAAFDSLFIENSEFKPPDLSRLPALKLNIGIPGLVAKPVQDPVAQAEILRLKLQRALAKKDQFAVQMIERDLQELIEKEQLAFGTTPEEDEAAEKAAEAALSDQQ